MNLRLATRRAAGLGSPSPMAVASSSDSGFSGKIKPTVQRRQKWSVNLFKGWGGSGSQESAPGQSNIASQLDDPKKRQQFLQERMRGGVEDSIFQDEIEAAPSASQETEQARQAVQRTKQSLAMVLDPDPRSRIRWQRRKVIQMVRRNGRLTREEEIKMSERELIHKSHFLPTSVKKLVMLARQIAGKPVDEAILQMQWSKKKMAAEIKYYLEQARDLAVAQRGMGLGPVNNELFEKTRKIQTKEGKWMNITDPSRMYIAQSWVGRGAWRGKSRDYKGRGRMGIIQHPTTCFTVILKEERTRIREFEERESKKAQKGPWVHLPNRPVHGQRPYYSW